MIDAGKVTLSLQDEFSRSEKSSPLPSLYLMDKPSPE